MATEDQKQRLKAVARPLRAETGMTQREIARRLEDRGFEVTGATISNYESGKTAPDDPHLAAALDEVLKADGQILDALGLLWPSDPLRERVTSLEARMADLESVVAELQRPTNVVPLEKPGRSKPKRTPRPDLMAAASGNPEAGEANGDGEDPNEAPPGQDDD